MTEPVAPTPAGVTYGLRFEGLPTGGLLPAGELPWPLIEVRQAEGMPAAETWFGEEDGLVALRDGPRRIYFERAARRATFYGSHIDPEDLIHPYLAPIGIAFARWTQREAFHAGAFLAGDGAWALIGDCEAGKSTLLAALAARGIPVLSDDLVVTDGTLAFAGPRSLDLRARPDAACLGGYLAASPSRQGTRWRVALGAVAPVFPLRGWFYLSWSDRLELERLSSAENLARLAQSRALPDQPTSSSDLLELAVLPAWEVRRPRSWPGLQDTIERLLSVATA